ncbi:uncharacterized protein [Temnothorax nylanderi]|uniref:uncharacterized protein isoform X2 n=1 Tax=Temnothorax nylanderi TaxID=102681 RepID=UPI003A898D00
MPSIEEKSNPSSFFPACSRRDPNIEKCILNNMDNFKDKLCEGIPELNIPPNDPFIVDKLVISETPDIKLYNKNMQIRGLCDYNVSYFHADMENFHFDLDLVFNHIRVNTTYDFDIRILIPIVQKGPLYITVDDIGAKVNLDFKIVTRNGKMYTYLAKMKLNLDIKKYTTQYGADGEQFNQLQEIIHNFIGQNQEEIINSFKPALEEAISKQIVSSTNNIVKHFTLDQLFSE